MKNVLTYPCDVIPSIDNSVWEQVHALSNIFRAMLLQQFTWETSGYLWYVYLYQIQKNLLGEQVSVGPLHNLDNRDYTGTILSIL